MTAKFGTFEHALAERYRFEGELGRGAMGIVYRATDVRLGRPVAIKMLHPSLTNEVGAARFESEIRIAAGLHHPNIVGVHDSGESDGRLFYVMDYLGGETLRARLAREKQLSVDDALSITEQVAAGLQYAHDRGIVHRDVKPENILVVDGRACIMDFGLARALSGVDEQRLTASGLAVGTPHYLSPEQASAEREVGPKADQYALACVLYEMLAGEPPFTGPTASAIAMRHIAEQPAPLRLRRKSAPPAVERAVAKAMEKVPGDRYSSTARFASALGVSSEVRDENIIIPREEEKRRRTVKVIAFAAAFVAAIGAATGYGRTHVAYRLADAMRSLSPPQLDSSRYLVLPSAWTGVGYGDPLLDDQLRDALAQWQGIVVPRSSEISGSSGEIANTPSPAESRSLARSLHAAHYVILQVTAAQSARRRVRADVFATAADVPPRSTVLEIDRGAAGEADLAKLASMILFEGKSAGDPDAATATHNANALRSYYRGIEATKTWNLPAADSALLSSVAADPSFAQALLALAQVRTWARDDAPDAPSLLERALRSATHLSDRGRLHAIALQNTTAGRYHEACKTYEALVASDSADFAAWYGLGECNRRDKTVVPNGKSSSGRSFRGSRERAILATIRAFRLLPNIDSCCIARADQVQRRSLIISATRVVAGRGVSPDSTIYGAYPGLDGDTITLVPYPIDELSRAPVTTRIAAVRAQQKLYLGIATRRVAAFPNSADALEELGEAMELRSQRSAIDTIRRASAVATDSTQRLRLAVTEIWLRLKFALPGPTAELRSVRISAESLLAHEPHNARQSDLLAGLAAVFSTPERAARMAAAGEQDLPPIQVGDDVLSTARALLVYAALGGPTDSIRDLDARLQSGIVNEVAANQQSTARELLISQSASLAFPVFQSRGFASLDPKANDLVGAEAAFARKDFKAVRRIVARLSAGRLRIPPADLSLDALYPEAWLLASIGDTTRALQVISPTLDAARDKPAKEWSDLANSVVLVRLMSLRARLSFGEGDRKDARAWALAVLALTGSASRAASDGTPSLATIAR